MPISPPVKASYGHIFLDQITTNALPFEMMLNLSSMPLNKLPVFLKAKGK